ncbi:MAG TPA: preprotein translocase subunit SecA [Bryobacteraceae bacterium]|nr:preprotein translocase subunit SecA [Bryobacteraceae bacterium]
MMITPSQEYRTIQYRVPERPLKGLDAAVNGCIGTYRRRPGVLTELKREADAVDRLAQEYRQLSDFELQQRLLEFRRIYRRAGKIPETALTCALAAIREAADRSLGLRPFVVQLMGALALHKGYLAEMATGEGKTLTAGLAAVLAGWRKRPCHVVTVNDYLVQRDAEWLRPLYTFCGVTAGFVTAEMTPDERSKGYSADVTYTTSKELLADFLRDQLRLGTLKDPTRRLIRELLSPFSAARGLVLRGLHTAIIDEADSLLIDEAVTPLIISSPRRNESLLEATQTAKIIASNLHPEADYTLNTRYREIELTAAGRLKLQEACSALPGFWRGNDRRLELLKQALVAREFFVRDRQYILENAKVVIVDEFTGRPMPQRTWREGLHQAIEAKEGLAISDPSETIARMSFQKFFRHFHCLSGMTGTAREAARELWQTYGLATVRIPTNRPCVRKHLPDRIFRDAGSKWAAVVSEIKRIHQTGRPILVGTRSVFASENLARLLTSEGLEFRVLNAVRLKEEASIVAMAGEHGRITIATNMAGRGTDIKLGAGVAALGGLHVIMTERHESRRVDRQLFGRAARQGDPGSAQAFVSAEDDLLRRYLPRPLPAMTDAILKMPLPGGKIITDAAFRLAQRKAQRLAHKQRRTVLRTDSWLDEALSFASQ